MRILVVEDERKMAELLRRGLGEEGHAVTLAYDGNAGVEIAEVGGFGLLILDVMLPKLSGFEIASRLRSKRNSTPILMLTARDSIADVIRGLDLGADDYLTKPFSFEILIARVRAVARRGPIPQPVHLEAGGLLLNPGTREVWRGSRRIDLTRTEYAILELLMRNAGRVTTRDSLIQNVWGDATHIESNTLDAFVRLLRAKVEEAGQSRVVQTVRGIGYALRP